MSINEQLKDPDFLLGKITEFCRKDETGTLQQRVTAHVRIKSGHTTLVSYHNNGASPEEKLALYSEIFKAIVNGKVHTLEGGTAAGQADAPAEVEQPTPKPEPQEDKPKAQAPKIHIIPVTDKKPAVKVKEVETEPTPEPEPPKAQAPAPSTPPANSFDAMIDARIQAHLSNLKLPEPTAPADTGSGLTEAQVKAMIDKAVEKERKFWLTQAKQAGEAAKSWVARTMEKVSEELNLNA